MLSLLVAHALGADPTVASQADGSILGTATIAASPAAVRAALADPVACGTLPPEVLSVTSTPAGKCSLVDTEARGPWNPLRWRALRCPTETGWRYDLVSSDDLDAMHAEWRVIPMADGSTTVEYHMDTDVAFAGVPDSLVRQGMIRSAHETLVRLVDRVVP